MAKPGCLLSALIVALTVLALLGASQAANSTRNEGAISCSTVTIQLSSCLSYVTGQDPKPSDQCCNGAKQMGATIKSKEDRQAVCGCIKNTLSKVSGVNYSRINQIPKICGVKINLPTITKDTDCKTIQMKDLMA